MNDIRYPGKELEIFSHARNWKLYWSSSIIPHIGETVLEVGAGIGSNTHLLCNNNVKRWVCLEPDAKLFRQLYSSHGKQVYTSYCELINGTLNELSQYDLFDTILYIDVLEHIEDDKTEIDLAIRHLEKQGNLIILSPAHNWLFSKFDEAIGHYRRYNKQMLKNLIPKGSSFIKLEYLDSVGLFMSLGNSIILKSAIPSNKQIRIWDSFIIPISKILDRLVNFHFGKSILAIWSFEAGIHLYQ